MKKSNIAPPCARGGLGVVEPAVPERESPEWLTPAAIFAAGNPNKILKKAPAFNTVVHTAKPLAR
jgi:hypothetical protein